MKNGLRNADQWAKFAWDQLCRTRHKLVTDGKTLETEEENLAEMPKRAGNSEVEPMPYMNIYLRQALKYNYWSHGWG